MPQKCVFFTVRVGEFGTGRHRSDARLLLSNPRRFGRHELGDERLGRAARRRYRHPTIGRVDPQVDVFDALAGELVFNAGGGHGVKIMLENIEEIQEHFNIFDHAECTTTHNSQRHLGL